MPIGTCWASGSWEDGAWADNTWANLGTVRKVIQMMTLMQIGDWPDR
jgi:hypothetical protein